MLWVIRTTGNSTAPWAWYLFACAGGDADYQCSKAVVRPTEYLCKSLRARHASKRMLVAIDISPRLMDLPDMWLEIMRCFHVEKVHSRQKRFRISKKVLEAVNVCWREGGWGSPWSRSGPEGAPLFPHGTVRDMLVAKVFNTTAQRNLLSSSINLVSGIC